MEYLLEHLQDSIEDQFYTQADLDLIDQIERSFFQKKEFDAVGIPTNLFNLDEDTLNRLSSPLLHSTPVNDTNESSLEFETDLEFSCEQITEGEKNGKRKVNLNSMCEETGVPPQSKKNQGLHDIIYELEKEKTLNPYVLEKEEDIRSHIENMEKEDPHYDPFYDTNIPITFFMPDSLVDKIKMEKKILHDRGEKVTLAPSYIKDLENEKEKIRK